MPCLWLAIESWRAKGLPPAPLLCMTRMLCCFLLPATAPPQMCTREAAAAAREAVEARLRAKRAMDDQQVAALMTAEVRRCEGGWLASCLGGWVGGYMGAWVIGWVRG